MAKQGAPERVVAPPLPSERAFGFLFAGVFAVAAVYAWYAYPAPTMAGVLASIALLFLGASLLAPQVLRPLNRAWAGLGMLLGVLVSPIVLGAIYFLLITPVALLTRTFGRDELRLRRTQRPSYWIDRDPVGPSSDSFKNQF